MPDENEGFPPDEPPAVFVQAQPAAATAGEPNDSDDRDGDDGLVS